jgi:hypothetical protein
VQDDSSAQPAGGWAAELGRRKRDPERKRLVRDWLAWCEVQGWRPQLRHEESRWAFEYALDGEAACRAWALRVPLETLRAAVGGAAPERHQPERAHNAAFVDCADFKMNVEAHNKKRTRRAMASALGVSLATLDNWRARCPDVWQPA